ncbi:DnaA N-terminal domain-containing protein [Singulisphaera sp. PoT]|uniref:DnaA N-terminal domain-containing protein n=1 Tax=Singulisphaera sp. PoT TaxID=3411797 RepID=UPI003BF49A57
MPYDPKLRVIARRTGQPMPLVVAIWACLLDAASQHDPRGVADVDAEEIAVAQDAELKAVQEIIEAFRAKGMIDGDNRLTAWSRRQHATSTERSQKHRASRRSDATARDGLQRGEATGKVAGRRATQEATDTDAEENADSDPETRKPLVKSLGERNLNQGRQAGGRGGDGNAAAEDQGRILEQMLDIWNEEVQGKLTRGRKAALTAAREGRMMRRWREDFRQDMQAWRHYCEIIGASDFCLGKIPGKGWTIDLGWAVESSDHVAKVLEGGFSGGRHPHRPPACHVPELQAACDAVLSAFEREHGRAACRSWLGNTAITGSEPRQGGLLIYMSCPSRFSREWIARHYLDDLQRLWADATATGVRVIGLQLVGGA